MGFGGLVPGGLEGLVAGAVVGGTFGVGVKRVVISTDGKSGAVDLVGVDIVADVTGRFKLF